MKNIVLVLLVIISNDFFGQDLKVMTYNIRFDLKSDGENSWTNRKEKVSNLIKFHQPDILGIQEGMLHQVQFLDSVLSDYKVFGKSRDPAENGEQCSIFYKKSKLELIAYDTFWLSETPLQISKGWDAALNRICTYGLFKDIKTKKMLWVFNTHFDHLGEIAQNKSAQLIDEKINQLNNKNYHVIIIGDFNLKPQSAPISFLSEEYVHTKSVSKLVYNGGGTFNGFEFHEPISSDMEIDHIFVSKKSFEINKYAVLTDSYSCKYPSDHFPVLVELNFIK